MRSQNGVSSVEVAMVFVVFSIVAVVALPVVGTKLKPSVSATSTISSGETENILKSAYAIAIAERGDFPRLNEIVECIDADFASETTDLSGIIFRDGEQRLTVKTYRDVDCKTLTSDSQPGVTDIVRCI